MPTSRSVALVVSLTCGLALAPPAVAGAGRSVRAPGSKKLAEIRARVGGGDALWVDGRLLWPATDDDRAPRLQGRLSWSRGGDAVAGLFENGGRTWLVVGVVQPGLEPRGLEWLLPSQALPARAIMWLGPRRVAVGPREMEPRVVASWTAPE
jgi:hypothetical protein